MRRDEIQKFVRMKGVKRGKGEIIASMERGLKIKIVFVGVNRLIGAPFHNKTGVLEKGLAIADG